MTFQPTFGLPSDLISDVRRIMSGKPVETPVKKTEEKIDEAQRSYVPNFDHTLGHLRQIASDAHNNHFAPTGSVLNSEFQKSHPEAHERLHKAFHEFRTAIEHASKAAHKTKPIKLGEGEEPRPECLPLVESKVDAQVYHVGFGFGDVMTKTETGTDVMFEHGIENVPTDTLMNFDQLTEAPIESIQVDTFKQAMTLGNQYHEKAKKAGSQAQRRAMAAVAARYYRKARILKQANDNMTESVEPTLEAETLEQIVRIAETTKADHATGESLVKSLFSEAGVHAYYTQLKKMGIEINEDKLNSKASNDDDMEADKHIVVQLRKSVSLRGQKHVEFSNGEKHQVPEAHARKALDMYGKLKPDARDSFHKKLTASHDSFKKAIGE